MLIDTHSFSCKINRRNKFTGEAHFEDSKEVIEGAIGEEIEEYLSQGTEIGVAVKEVQKHLSMKDECVDRQVVWCRSTPILCNSQLRVEL